MSRLRSVAGWLPAVLVVPAGLAALVQVSAPSNDAVQQMADVMPLDPGTTWTYAVSDHGEPSGQRIRQVLGPAQLFRDGTLRSGVRLSSVYDDYPGRGAQSLDAYVGVQDRSLLQYGLIGASGEQQEIEPPAPAYELPAEPGTSWHYEGTLGHVQLVSDSVATDQGDVQVGGHTFRGCTEWTTHQQVPDPATGELPEDPEVEVLVEWTCPGIGVVRSHDVLASDDVDITEELVAFRGVDQEWSREPTAAAEPLGEVTAEGVDQARTNAVPDGTLTDTLAWSDSRKVVSTFGPVSDGTVEVVGENDGLVSAQDVATGQTRWQVALPPPIVTAPAVGGGLAYVADGAKNLWALSMTDGSARWVHHFEDVVSTVPALGEEAVVVAVDDGSVVALGRADGAELWSAGLAGRSATAPAVSVGRLVVGDDSGTLTAFDLDSGEEQWSASLEDGLAEGPVISDGHVVAADDVGVVWSYDLADGSVQWQARAHDYVTQPLAVGAEVVVAGEDHGRVEAFDLDDGSRSWRRELAPLGAAPLLVGDQVAVVGEDGAVQVLGADDGRQVTRWSLPAPESGASLGVVAPLGVVDHSLVVTVQVAGERFDATSYAYRLRGDGPAGVAFRSRARTFPVPPAAPPVVDGDDTYALGFDGTVYRNAGSGPEPVVSDVSPTLGFGAGGGVVVVPTGKEVRGVRGADGEQLWTLPTGEGYLESLPAIAGDTAYVPVHGVGLVAVGLRDGKPRWVAPTPGSTGSTTPLPLPGGDVAYAAAGLARFDGRTGEEVWRLTGPLADAAAYSELAEADGTVYALLVDPAGDGTEHTHAVAVDARSGTLRWDVELPTGAAFSIGPAVGDGTVVVVDGTNQALALDAASGAQRWSFPLDSAPAGPATVHDGVVVLVAQGRSEDLRQRDFRVTAHDASTGAFLGAYQPPVANGVTLSTGASGPGGTTLVSTAGADGAYVLLLEARRG